MCCLFSCAVLAMHIRRGFPSYRGRTRGCAIDFSRPISDSLQDTPPRARARNSHFLFEQQGAEEEVAMIGGDEPHGADPEDTASHAERTMEQVLNCAVLLCKHDSSPRLYFGVFVNNLMFLLM